MSGIKRYDVETGNYEEGPCGDFVEFADHEDRVTELEAEIARLRAEVEHLNGELALADSMIAKLRAEADALRRDAMRWRFFQTAGYNVTLRMHYTRPDEREKAIDAAMGADA